MNREEIITFINRVVRAEHGMPMKNDDDKLVETGCDSFGITMILLELDNEYGVYTRDELKNIVIQELTLGTIVERVQNETRKTLV